MNQKQIAQALTIYGLCLVVSYIYPIHLHPYRTFYQDEVAILGLLMACGFLAYVNPKVTVQIPNSIIVPFCLIMVISIQMGNGYILYPIDMLFPMLYLICLAIALTFGATIAKQDSGLNQLAIHLAYSYIAIGFLSVLFQHVQIINLDFSPWINPISFNDIPRPFANVAQPNLLALALCFAVISVWYVYIKNRIKPWVAITLILFLLWGLALTQSRIAWIILPVYLILCWHQPPQSPKVSKWVLLLLLLAFISFVFCLADLLTWLGAMSQSVEHRAGQTSIRLILWRQAWTMSLLHPWLGVGWYQFGPQQVMLSSLFASSEYSEFAHNILLNFLAEIGWPLTVLFCAGALYWFYTCCMRRWANVQVRFVSMMLIAVAVHSMVEFPLWYGFVLMPFGVMVGALHTEQVGLKIVSLARSLIFFVVTIGVLLMAGITWDYARVVDGFAALVWQQEGKKNGVGSTEKPELTVFPQFYDYFQIAKINVTPNMPKEDIQFLERASLRFGFMPVLSRLALAYAYNQRPNEALQVLITIQRIKPFEYDKVYADWIRFAQQDPGMFGEIAKRMPKPAI